MGYSYNLRNFDFGLIDNLKEDETITVLSPSPELHEVIMNRGDVCLDLDISEFSVYRKKNSRDRNKRP